VLETCVVCQNFLNFVLSNYRSCMSVSLNILCLIRINHETNRCKVIDSEKQPRFWPILGEVGTLCTHMSARCTLRIGLISISVFFFVCLLFSRKTRPM